MRLRRRVTQLLSALYVLVIAISALAGSDGRDAEKCVTTRWRASRSFEGQVVTALRRFGPLGSGDRDGLARAVTRASTSFDAQLERLEETIHCPPPFDLPKEMLHVMRSRDLVTSNDRIAAGLGSEVLDSVLGDCHDETVLPSIGCSKIQGPIAGRTFDPVSTIAGTKFGYRFVFTELRTTHTAVATTDFPTWCGDFSVNGRALYVSLFQDPSQAVSVVSQPGTFDVWLPDLNGQVDPGTGNVAIVQVTEVTPDGGTGQLADSGTVTVEEVSASEIAGRLDVTIAGERVTATFRAPFCAPWTRSGDVPGTGECSEQARDRTWPMSDGARGRRTLPAFCGPTASSPNEGSETKDPLIPKQPVPRWSPGVQRVTRGDTP